MTLKTDAMKRAPYREGGRPGGTSGLRIRMMAACVAAVVLFAAVDAIAAQPARSGVKTPGIESMRYDSALFVKKKDPIFAGMLSWYMPGLGQYYSGEYVKGTVFLVTEYALAIGSILYFMDFDFAAGDGSGFSIRIDAKRTDLGVISTSRKNVFIGLMSLLAVMHLYNISDAVVTARNYNTALDAKRNLLKEKYPGIDLSYDSTRGVFIGFSTRL